MQEARLHGTPVSTLHLVAHGRPGALRLGGQWITTTSLLAAADQLASWGVQHIRLWSCHTGAEAAFAVCLSELTGATVLASSTTIGVGHSLKLDAPAPHQESLQTLFNPTAIATWNGTLLDEYDVSGQRIQLQNPTLLTTIAPGSTQIPVGTQFLYQNIVTVDGQVIDAVVTLNGYQRAEIGIDFIASNSLQNFDNVNLQYSSTVDPSAINYDPNAPSYFQPNITIIRKPRTGPIPEAYTDFNISFYKPLQPGQTTREAVILNNLTVNFYDIDGNGTTARQFVEVDEASSYKISADSRLLITAGIGGEDIRFAAKPTEGGNYQQQPGTIVGDSIRSAFLSPFGVSSLNFQLGDTAYSGTTEYLALYALDFSPGPAWSGPTLEFGLNAQSVAVGECGNQVQLTVQMVGSIAPTADITVNLFDFFNRKAALGSLPYVVTNPDGSITVNGEFTLSSSQLVFTREDWNVSKSILVTGLDDNVIDGDSLFKGVLRASTSDSYYNQLTTAVNILNLDNDTLITAPTVFGFSSFAVFDITAAAGRTLLLTALDGTTSGIGSASIETSTDGTTWTPYNSSGFKVPGTGAVTLKARVSLASLGEFDGTQTFKLQVGSPGVPCPREATATVVGLASIGNHVWLDANANGQQDIGENGLAGVAVELYTSVNGQPSGAALATLTTDANGDYWFRNQPSGDYIVRVITPTGYYLTAANIGSDDTTDSDAGSDGYSGTYTLPLGTIETTVDAGLYQFASIAGTVYADTNNNGIQDNGETGIGGVILTITGSNGLNTPVSRTITTASDGTYSIADLVPGTYTVTETQPSSFLDGIDAVGSSGGTLGADRVSGISLASGTTATGYNFG